MKKTLLFITGIELLVVNEPTRLCISENRLTDEELKIAGVPQVTSIGDALVLCRIFQKSRAGPNNGEQYGAPYLEEEWEEDKITFVPEQDALCEGLVVDDDKDKSTISHSWEWSRDWNWDFIGQFSLSVHPLIIGVTGLLLLESYLRW
ncbi:NAC domain-containing protein 78-like [Brassica napus]|uniref:NAC domain-containing protein 78-like n=1 Tax=Brassica napus TaxID=3708 RepID=UPI0020786122|nr:NAC domain-containing protein 78-like [Brassica napus]